MLVKEPPAAGRLQDRLQAADSSLMQAYPFGHTPLLNTYINMQTGGFQMLLFEKMLDMGKRQEFLEYRAAKKNTQNRTQEMRDYLLSSRYEEDVRRLSAGDYHISLPVKKEIPKGYTDRKRTVYHFKEDEMTLFRMMSYALHDYEDLFPREVYSFKLGSCARDLVLSIGRNQSLRTMYVVKTDVMNYGNSVDPDRLVEMIHGAFGERDPGADAFFTWLFQRKSFVYNGVVTQGDTSALPGIPIHNFFTNLYLTDMDKLLIPLCKKYARYSDDIIMFLPTVEEAKSCMDLLLSQLEGHGLTPHSGEKTAIHEPGASYDYLGFNFCKGQVDISEKSVKKLKRKMRIRAKKIGIDRKGIHSSLEEKVRHLIYLNRLTFFGRPDSDDLCWSRWAFPVITGTERLHELDLYNQRCIRYVLTGKWSDCQYRVKYRQLKELGYESLVRAYFRHQDTLLL